MTSSFLLLQLLLLSLAAVAMSQNPPKIDYYGHDRLVRVNVSTMEGRTIWCPNKNGFLGITDKNNMKFLTKSRNYGVDLRYKVGNYESLQQMREAKLGGYHCLYRESDSAPVNAYSYVFSEVPLSVKSTNTQRFTSNTEPREFLCPGNEADDIVWERYQDGTGLFVPQAEGIRYLVLNYSSLLQDQSKGFTIYRCFDKKNPEKIEYFEAKKSKSLKIRTFQTSNYSSQLIPKLVNPTDRLSIECHGRLIVNESAEIVFYFHSLVQDTGVYNRINCSIDNQIYKCTKSQGSWQLEIMDFSPKLAGRYYCVKDGVVQRARVEGNLGEVQITNKPNDGKYFIRNENNKIICRPTQTMFMGNIFFTIYRKDKQPLKLEPNSSADGISIVNTESQVEINFDFRDDLDGANVICQLHYAMDSVILKRPGPDDLTKVYLTSNSSGSSRLLYCSLESGDNVFSDRYDKIVKVLYNGTEIPLRDVKRSISTVISIVPKDDETFQRYKCYRNYKGYTVQSKILTFGKLRVNLDIYIDGDKNPTNNKVYLAGRDAAIQCSFTNLPSDILPNLQQVQLFKNGSRLLTDMSSMNDTVFEFKLLNVGPESSGSYRCVYGPTSFFRSEPLTGSYRSPDATILVCTTDSFVCDGMCKNKTLMCDGKQDCSDGFDEQEDNCNKCEPNSVRCESVGGEKPKRECVLKHWLCDGHNDCGNGFDENVSLHSKWCFKEDDCTRCKPEETCCPSNKTRCILRSYECDNELDCPGDAINDNSNCDKANCLEVTKPTKREVIEKRVGESVSMNCVAKGAERPTINWRRNWASVPSSGSQQTNAVILRESSGKYLVEGNLILNPITKSMAGIYNCEAINNCNRILSYEIELRVVD